jgi:hypothetical protein
MDQTINAEVVSVGFPHTVLAFFTQSSALAEDREGIVLNVRIFRLQSAIDMHAFEEWKSGIQLWVKESSTGKKNVTSAADGIVIVKNDVIDLVRKFPIASKTPVECMLFLDTLQQKIS